MTTCFTSFTQRLTSIMLGVTILPAWIMTTQAATFNIANGDVAGLISAIQTANANGESNTINLAANGTYLLTTVAEGQGEYWGPVGLPYVTSTLAINGNGATIMRSSDLGTPAFRILFMGPGNLTLDRVTLMGGAGDSMGDFGDAGGGLAISTGTAFITNSTITHNSATFGGGIYNFCSTLTILNSTISYNTGYSGYGGGGILDFSSSCQNVPYYTARAFISFSTIFENQSAGTLYGRGDAIADGFSAPNSITLKNNILASPTRGLGSTCAFFTPVSGGHNIAADSSCDLTGPGDLINTNPLLGPTANNGGPTLTDLPLPNSPVVDAVPLSYCSDAFGVSVTTDQRGISRPQGSACDAGSVELVQGPKYQLCLLYDPTKAVPGGATDPIKLQLCDPSGNDLSSTAITLHAASATQVSTSISGAVQSPGNANPDNDFRFDATLGPTGGYIFNLSTKGMATGTYNLNFTVTGDSFVYAALFQVK